MALVAEVMPDRARPYALGLLQALSALGNVSAALLNMGMAKLSAAEVVSGESAWRWMFVVGALPALFFASESQFYAVDGSPYRESPPRWYFGVYTREQVEHCYPMFRSFLAEKRRQDPRESMQNSWYRHYRFVLMRPSCHVSWASCAGETTHAQAAMAAGAA